MVRLGICGAEGRVGQLLIKKINDSSFNQQFLLSRTFTRKNKATDIDEFCKNSEIVIDFSNPDVLPSLVKSALKFKTKLVIGTTGLQKENFNQLQEASKQIAILYSANMTFGANLIAILAKKASEFLDQGYDVAILDKHHKSKIDSPSGTAIMLAKTIATTQHFKSKGIDFSSIRAGGIYGEHEVIFANNSEVITIKHQALNRDCFAEGALKAAKWLIHKEIGFYSMMDLLDFFHNENN